jgi:hypothetical protein
MQKIPTAHLNLAVIYRIRFPGQHDVARLLPSEDCELRFAI